MESCALGDKLELFSRQIEAALPLPLDEHPFPAASTGT